MKLPGPLTADQEKQLNTIRTSARHLLSIINDLLDLAKIESGKVKLNPEPIVCQSVIEEVTSALRPMALAKGLAFEVSVPPEEVTVRTDRRALSQILINISNNAIKFTQKGKIAVSLERQRQNGNNFVVITVTDTGVGIKQEDQAKLFQAFAQLDDSTVRRFEGTGLGLHLSQKLASLLGAQISLVSEYERGTAFTISIPDIEPPEKSDPA